MTTAADAQVIALGDAAPEIAGSAWVATGIHVGAGSNVQDGCVLHADPGFPTVLGGGVSLGHRAVGHGSRIGDNVLLEGTEVPAGSLVAGTPGTVRRTLTDDEIGLIAVNAEHYQQLRLRHASAGA